MVVLATWVEICFILRGILDTFDINYYKSANCSKI